MARKKITRHINVRTIISIIVAVVLIGSISYLGVKTYQDSHAASGASISINPSSTSLTPGSTVSFTIREDSGSDPVNSVQASLNYDSTVLQFVSLVEGGAFPIVAANTTGTANVIRVGRGTAGTPLTGEQPIVTINFKVIGTSGSTAVSFEKAYSLLVRSTDSKDILQTVGNGSYTIVSTPTPPPPPPPSSSTKPIFYLTPASGTFGKGKTLSAAVKLNGYSNAVTTAQAVLNYPADKLKYLSVNEGGVFTTIQRTRNSNGSLDIIRGVPGGNGGIQGDNTVITVNFEVISDDGSAALGFAGNSAVFDNSGTGASILNNAGSTGASYTIAADGGGTTPPPSGDTGSGPTKVVTSASQGFSISTNNGGHASLTNGEGGSATELNGKVTLSPTTATDGASIDKVEYYLGKKLVSTQKTPPYAYKFDTTKLRNGSYVMTVKTYFTNGSVDTKTENIVVKNKVNLTYVLRQYAPSALVLIAILAVCAFLVWKLVIPRFAFGKHTPPHAHDYDVMYGFGDPSTAQKPVMDDPVVYTPSASTVTPSTDAVPPPAIAAPVTVAEPAPVPTAAMTPPDPTIIRPTESPQSPQPPASA